MAATPIPVSPPLNAAANSHLVVRVGQDGYLTVQDATSNQPRNLRLAVVSVAGQRTGVAVGDP
jgi:hypothetical protein